MKKTLVLASAMLALAASLASAAGVNLAFDDCVGNGGTPTKSWLCNVNSGVVFPIVGSFIPPPGVNEFLGISAQVDITAPDGTLPDWWKHGTSQCRSTSGLSVSFDFTTFSPPCVDFYMGQAAGGFAYDVGFGGAHRARMRLQCAVPIGNRGPVNPSSEYYGFNMRLLAAKSSGTGSCADCLEPVCIVLNEIQLFQPPAAANDPQIINPAVSNFVTWQAPTLTPSCPESTPTRNSSWGQVKSLYR